MLTLIKGEHLQPFLEPLTGPFHLVVGVKYLVLYLWILNSIRTSVDVCLDTDVKGRTGLNKDEVKGDLGVGREWGFVSRSIDYTDKNILRWSSNSCSQAQGSLNRSRERVVSLHGRTQRVYYL